jgi:hypothetical protein
MMARAWAGALAGVLVIASAPGQAHDGPPFPILSDHVAGPYVVSIWTDPDTTDDGSPGGQFWVRLHRAATAADVPPETRATVALRPLGRTGPPLTAPASPVRGDVTNQFAAIVMDHEGRFAVHVAIDGPLGAAAADATVEATYDLRPSKSLLVLYVVPFLLVGLLWGRMLLRRRRAAEQHSPEGGSRES